MTVTATPGSADLPLEQLTELLSSWLPSRRWYPAKGAEARLVNIVGTSVSPLPSIACTRSAGSFSRTVTTPSA